MANEHELGVFRAGVVAGVGGGLLLGMGVMMIAGSVVMTRTQIGIVQGVLVLLAIVLFVGGVALLRGKASGG